MKTIDLKVRSRRELHDLFEKEFPAPYGRTLDALHDILSTYPEALELVLHSAELYAALGDRYCDNLMQMLDDTQQENPKLTLRKIE